MNMRVLLKVTNSSRDFCLKARLVFSDLLPFIQLSLSSVSVLQINLVPLQEQVHQERWVFRQNALLERIGKWIFVRLSLLTLSDFEKRLELKIPKGLNGGQFLGMSLGRIVILGVPRIILRQKVVSDICLAGRSMEWSVVPGDQTQVSF